MDAGFAPGDVLRIFLRHKRKIFAVWLLGTSAAVAALLVLQPAYRSEAQLFLRLGRENATLDTAATRGLGPAIAVPSSREEEINSIIEVLGNRAILEQVVDELGPAVIMGGAAQAGSGAAKVESSQAPLIAYAASFWESAWQRVNPIEEFSLREQALSKLGRRLSIGASRRSNVVAITYDGPSPEVAQQVVAKIVDLYLDQHVRMYRTPGSHEFFSSQADEVKSRLTDTENALCELRNSTGLASVLDQRKLLIDRLGGLDSEIQRNAAELSGIDAEVTLLSQRFDAIPGSVVSNIVKGQPNAAADGMRQQLYALQLKEQEYKSIYTSEMPQLREVRRQIQEAQAVLGLEDSQRQQVTTAINANQIALEMALVLKRAAGVALRAKADVLGTQRTTAREELQTLNENSLKLAQLERDVQVQEANYRRHAENLEQARIDQQLQTERISNVSVVQPASISAVVVRPQKQLILLGGLLGGLVCGLALALAVEYFDHSFKSVEDVERMLQVPALVSVPRLPHEASPPSRKQKARRA